ncbi:GGDEF domain-containing protein [Vibrio sp. LaRot3]|uniref:GGDEF domain-containing protein n=1 Tax=Vibrio sp. LaRot3 TaxID=2998829 RepID=UPI0022CE09D9|nr:GGDEF domain-containing protein [Vibrio sp. LaRot3]MDA0150564.1 GGDEF domain-containing protein [Vibrio sp. LaRot3]
MTGILDSTANLRRRVLKGLCLNLGFAALVLGLGNLFFFEVKAPMLGVLELGYCSLSFWMLLDIKSKPVRGWFLPCHTFILATLVIYGTTVHTIQSMLFLWSLALPTVFYLALGKRVAVVTSAVFLVTETCIVIGALSNTVINPEMVLANFSLAYVCVWVISHVYEASREKAVNELRHMALHDPLTQALNRRALVHQLKHQAGSIDYLLMFDVDDFKHINDSLGHEGGDDVLKAVVERLQNACGPEHVYRTGGEEFIVTIGDNLPKDECINCFVHQIQSVIGDSSIVASKNDIHVTFSGGLVKNAHFLSEDQILTGADENLYLAKKNGKNRVFYHESLLDTQHCLGA